MSEEKQGSGAVGVIAGAGAAGLTAVASTKAAANRVIQHAIEGKEAFVEGGKKAVFGDAVRKVAETAGEDGVKLGDKFKGAFQKIDDAAATLKPESGVGEMASKIGKATTEGSKDFNAALKGIKEGLTKLEKPMPAWKNIKGKHAVAIVGATVVAGVGTKAIADRVFGKHTAKVEAERASAPAQAAGRA